MMIRAAALSVALMSPMLWAAEPINVTRPLQSGASLSVNNTSGLIEVSVWDRNEVQIRGELGEGSEPLEISGNADHLEIAVRLKTKERSAEGSTLLLRVPEQTRLTLTAVSADIEVSGVKGDLLAHSVSGDLALSVGSEQVEARSVSGNIELQAPAKKSNLHSVSGDIVATGLADSLRAETVSGNVEVRGGRFHDISMRSISGDYRVDAGLAESGTLIGETLSGDMEISLQPPVGAKFSLRSFSGKVRTDLEDSRSSTDDPLSFTVGNGRGRVDLSSFSGDIRLYTE